MIPIDLPERFLRKEAIREVRITRISNGDTMVFKWQNDESAVCVFPDVPRQPLILEHSIDPRRTLDHPHLGAPWTCSDDSIVVALQNVSHCFSAFKVACNHIGILSEYDMSIEYITYDDIRKMSDCPNCKSAITGWPRIVAWVTNAFHCPHCNGSFRQGVG
jgi:hypothetical protein